MKEHGSFNLKSFIAGAAAAAVLILVIRQAVLWLPVSASVDDPASMAAVKKTHEITHYIDEVYLGDIDKQKLTDYMYLGLLTGLEDPYSTYYTKAEYDEINMSQQGEYRGVGITIATREEDGALMIVDVISGGPAEAAGLLPGDEILKIDGNNFKNASSSAVVDYVRSLETDSAVFTVLREDTAEELEFTVKIEKLEALSVAYSMLEDNIGYIQVSSFTAVTAKQFDDARKSLEEDGMKALVIDLRNNQGGLVNAVYDMLCSMMPEGLLFYTESKDGTRKEYSCEGENPLEIPMAVLVNDKTASASEIFAGAVKDYGVAKIIGTVTYGKGIVQNAYILSDGSVIRLTVSHYYTPNGNDIHKHGITPDLEVTNPTGADLQLNKALDYLKEEIG